MNPGIKYEVQFSHRECNEICVWRFFSLNPFKFGFNPFAAIWALMWLRSRNEKAQFCSGSFIQAVIGHQKQASFLKARGAT